jgi:hypothetical protein
VLTIIGVLNLRRRSMRVALALTVLASAATLTTALTGIAAPVTVPNPIPTLLVFVLPGVLLLDAGGVMGLAVARRG